MIINNEIINELEKIVGKDNIKINESMAKHTSFKVGGVADVFIKVRSIEEIKNIINKNKQWNLAITIVGNGSNLLVGDNGIRGIVIKYVADSIEIENKPLKNITQKELIEQEYKNKVNINDTENGVIVNVAAGMLNGKLAQILLTENLSGFEFAAGIPGTIGGAIYMNAGAYGSEMKDIIQEVTYIDLLDEKIYTIENEKCNFEYRKSIFEEMNVIILSTKLLLKRNNEKDIKEKMNEYKEKRIKSQPINMPSAGSTFKRGNGFITAQLIDEAGLKGYRIGGAEVSTKHAGFIINSNNAKAEDIIKLIEYVKENVYKKFGKKIEAEVRIIGE